MKRFLNCRDDYDLKNVCLHQKTSHWGDLSAFSKPLLSKTETGEAQPRGKKGLDSLRRFRQKLGENRAYLSRASLPTHQRCIPDPRECRVELKLLVDIISPGSKQEVLEPTWQGFLSFDWQI